MRVYSDVSTFLQTSDGDIALVNGSYVVINDAREVAQKIENDFQLWLGEWFADVTIGMPWFQKILLHNPDLNVVKQIFKEVITNSPRVLSLTTFTQAFDRKARRYSYTFTAKLLDGTVISGGNSNLEFT